MRSARPKPKDDAFHPGRPNASALAAWSVWGLGAAFYFTGFFHRVAPAVMTDALMADFGIGGAALGHLSAVYFYSYVAMQIPTGILSDSWGPRRLLAAGSLIAGLGAFLFALSSNILVAGAGRLLIGASVGVGWVSLLKLSMNWFPPRRYALATGLALLCGVCGAVSAGVPLRVLVEGFGWRPVTAATGAATLILSVTIWIVVRDRPSGKGDDPGRPRAAVVKTPSPGPALRGLVEVLGHRNTWLLTIVPGGIVGPLLSFSGLWGVPYLTARYGLSPTQSASITSALLVSWALGGPVLGALSDRIGRRRPLYALGAAIVCAGWGLALYGPGISVRLFTALMVVVGFASGAIIIGFPFAKESVPSHVSGTVTGVCNMGYMAGPMLLQPLIGKVLDQFWTGTLVNGSRVYSPEAYRFAFVLILGFSLVAAIAIHWTRETHCRQKAT